MDVATQKKEKLPPRGTPEYLEKRKEWDKKFDEERKKQYKTVRLTWKLISYVEKKGKMRETYSDTLERLLGISE